MWILRIVEYKKDDADQEHEEFRPTFVVAGNTKVERARDGPLERDLLSLSLSWQINEE
jgi:hypothetical protein